MSWPRSRLRCRRPLEKQSGVKQAERMAVESRITTGAPYSADSVTESVQVLSDGNRIARKTTTRIYRDSEGRTRREQLSPRWRRAERQHQRSRRRVDLRAQSSRSDGAAQRRS